MTDTDMAIIQRGNTEELRALVFQKDAQCTEKDKTIEWQRQQFDGRITIVANGVDYLVSDRKKKKASNVKRGTENQTNGNREERDRAATDMKNALKRVHDDPDVRAGKHGAVLAACRRVCREFTPLTSRKNALGKYEEYAPLTGAGGESIKPETLAKNYRKRYGTKKPRATSRRTK